MRDYGYSNRRAGLSSFQSDVCERETPRFKLDPDLEDLLGVGTAIRLRQLWGDGIVSHNRLVQVHNSFGNLRNASLFISAYALLVGAGMLIFSVGFPGVVFFGLVAVVGTGAGCLGIGLARRCVVLGPATDVARSYLDLTKAASETANTGESSARKMVSLRRRFAALGDRYRLPEGARRFNPLMLPSGLPKVLPQDVRLARKGMGLV